MSTHELSEYLHANLLAWYLGVHDRILASPDLHSLRRSLQIDANPGADVNAYRKLHRRIIEHNFLSLERSAIDLTVGAIDKFVREGLGVPPVAHIDDPGIRSAARALSEVGHASLPALEPEIVADMRAYFEPQPVYPGFGETGGDLTSLEKARDRKFAYYPLETVFACPHLVATANDPRTLFIIERYLGTTPIIIGYCAWWSFTDSKPPEEAQLYHMDIDDHRFVKLFIYLTEVGANDGPHTYIEGTHDQSYIRAVRDRWPGGIGEFDTWYFSTLRKSDTEIRRVFDKEPVALCGPVGTQFVADTSGIHKGQPPKRADRLVCRVLYGVSPNFTEYFEPVGAATAAARHIPEWATEPPHSYLNWLFVA